MKNIKVNHEAINKVCTKGGIVLITTAAVFAVSLKSCSWFKSTDDPMPTVTPVIETPVPTYDPFVTPSPVPTNKPIIDIVVTPTPMPDKNGQKPVDNSKAYRDEAQRVINNCNGMVDTIDENRNRILDSIESLQNYYHELKNDYNTISGLLNEADKLISENKDNGISKDLQDLRDGIKKQLDAVEKELADVLKQTDSLINEYQGLDTSVIKNEISNLQNNIPNVKDKNDLNPYYELEKKIADLLNKSNDIKQEASKNDNKLVDHKPVSDSEKYLDDMKGIKDKADKDNDHIGGGSGNSGYVPPVDPSPVPTPGLPEPDHTYDKNDNIDDTIFNDTDEPLEEPDMDLDGPVITI